METHAPAWRERVATRTAGSVLERSAQRSDSLVASARRLAVRHGADFTVAQVVAGAGMSLKSFYRHFAGKDDLLLALLEEDNRHGAERLATLVDRHRAPLRRVEAFVRGLFGFLTDLGADDGGDPGGAPAYMALLVAEHQRLARQRPTDVDAAVAPFVDLLATELRVARDAGLVRDGPPERDAATVFHLVLSQLHPLVLGHSLDDPAETATYLWRFVHGAVGATRAVPS